MLILIAGPYRGGTNDDPKLIERDFEPVEAQPATRVRQQATRAKKDDGQGVLF